MFEFELPEKFRRYVPLAVWLILALVLLLIPLKIIGYGYLPGDDALRHCAKAVSGKTWPEILVLGDNFKIDHNLGWHNVLGAVHQRTGWNAEGLLIFSVVALFLLVNFATLPWLKRPEAWLVALTAAMIVSDVPRRFLLGRPFTLTIAALMVILLVTHQNRPAPKYFVLFAGLITACTYTHGVWYLWLLPVMAFFFAGEFRWGTIVAAAWLTGALLAALLTGHPVDYLVTALTTALHGVGQHLTNRTEVTELQPFSGDILAMFIVGALIGLRLITKSTATSFIRSPAFWLMCGCWMLGFRISRFWEDWGWPALMVLIALDVGLLLHIRVPADSLKRLLLTIILAMSAFFSVTSDLHARYTKSLNWQFLSVAEHPDLAGWMPEKNGILYSADMNVFYQTFFKNPNGDWRYMLGYESTLMPTVDFETFQKILWNSGDANAYEPWVKKMTPADRLVISGNRHERPDIPQLEWFYGPDNLWIGRTPRASAR